MKKCLMWVARALLGEAKLAYIIDVYILDATKMYTYTR
jgi:hypothetical protein